MRHSYQVSLGCKEKKAASIGLNVSVQYLVCNEWIASTVHSREPSTISNIQVLGDYKYDSVGEREERPVNPM